MEAFQDVFAFDSEQQLCYLKIQLLHNVGSLSLPIPPFYTEIDENLPISKIKRGDFSFEGKEIDNIRQYLCDDMLIFSYTTQGTIFNLDVKKVTDNLFFLLDKENILKYIVVTKISTFPFRSYYLDEKILREIYFLAYTYELDDGIQLRSLLQMIQSEERYKEIFKSELDDLIEEVDDFFK
ncbi:hypothetical protein [Capnocytophaga sputigena]|uniref:hypothetical protein n=1 Tax=Capnocytophaga sputigena TaxID=1019 RepID=UPI0028D6DDC5|nr:hypothetical protein [Capnocytophaga sputigena]